MSAAATTRGTRAAVAAMWVGLGLSVVALIVLYADHATGDRLAAHIRAGYATYPPGRVDSAVTIYLAYLSAVGVVAIVSWLWAIRAVRSAKRWARPAAIALFTLGTALALTDLLIRDTSGDTGLPPLLGWVGVLPCLPGLLAVTLLRRR